MDAIDGLSEGFWQYLLLHRSSSFTALTATYIYIKVSFIRFSNKVTHRFYRDTFLWIFDSFGIREFWEQYRFAI